MQGNMDTVSPDKIPTWFILGCHQHRAQRADDIKEVLNILEKETHQEIRLNVCGPHCCEVINAGSNVVNAPLREELCKVLSFTG